MYNNCMIKIDKFVEYHYAVFNDDGEKIASQIIEQFDKNKSVVELDFENIAAANIAFFDGIISYIVKERGYKNFIKNRYFTVTNCDNALSITYASSLSIADTKYNWPEDE